MQQIFIYSPLEQFQVFPILSFYFLGHDFSITNEVVILVLALGLTLGFFSSLFQKSGDNTLDLIPKRRQSALEIIFTSMLSLVIDNIKDEVSQKFFPLVVSLFLFILSLNLMGLIPYSFTLTSHLIVTFFISLSVFVGINIICARKHGVRMFALFLPSGTSVLLAFLLVPIELISYIFKPVSLSIRLFANMMAGHTLLKVIAGFAYVLMGNKGILFLMQYVPLFILIPLFGLELGVALIQSFVYSILICIYLNDSINLH
jgi:ATP synthase subunit 6